MKRLISALLFLGTSLLLNATPATSPNGKLTAETTGNKLVICFEGQTVLQLADIPFDQLEFVRPVSADYRMLEGKRLHCTNEANEYQAPVGKYARIVMRLYNDGVAFRYEYTNLHNSKVPAERTSYVIPEGTKRWMQQWSDGYEGFFPMTTTAEVKTLAGFGGSFTTNRINTHWGYPLLMEPAEGVFALITEANIERRRARPACSTKASCSAWCRTRTTCCCPATGTRPGAWSSSASWATSWNRRS